MSRSVLVSLLLPLAACTAADVDHGQATADACDSLAATGWAEESHAKGFDGNYALLFDGDEVPRLDISICADDHEAMWADLDELFASTGGGGPGDGGPGDGGPGAFPEEDPIYVPVNIGFDGRTWPMVGMRFKGNSSLASAYTGGVDKLPFRLAMDRYEDEVPEVDDQRMWGFKDLKFSSAYDDPSLIRDKLAADTFRDAGVPAASGGFMRVYVDVGDGPVFWGVYTAFEDPAGELLDDWFGDDDGNAYKPDGTTATLSDYSAADFEKKTNEELADDSDIRALVQALNADRSDAAAWRAQLEQTLDVDGVLRYLAVNNLIGNWDSYGAMTHNYYLYGDPGLDGRLVWIPWDFNESYRADGRRAPVSVSMDEVASDWPLIRYLADDPVYSAAYYGHVEELLASSFSVEAQQERMSEYHERVAEWAAAEQAPYTFLGRGDFDDSLEGGSLPLFDRVEQAHAEAEQALSAR